MPRVHAYFVYIMASRSRTLYIGVTNDLPYRAGQHREATKGFTARYRIDRLVYFERFQYIRNAIAREKYLKYCLRAEKIALIESENPTWEDLAEAFPGMKEKREADPPPAAKDDKQKDKDEI